jgi:hypothetical protein
VAVRALAQKIARLRLANPDQDSWIPHVTLLRLAFLELEWDV